ELDLPDAAAPELHVGDPLFALAGERVVDAPLHLADGRHDGAVDAGPPDYLAHDRHERVAHARVARGDPRFQERLALPQLRALGVVTAIAVERERDRARTSFRAQPH